LSPDDAARVKHFECGASIFGKGVKLRRLLRRTGFSARDVLCVGDEMRDYDAAQETGMDFVGVAWGYTAPAALQHYSDAPLVTSAAEILDVVRRRAARR
jgi:phosphoglycolate phosphatase